MSVSSDNLAHLQLLLELRQQRGANEPRAHDADGQRQCREVEARVHGPQRPDRLGLLHQDGDIVLAAALRDRPAETDTSQLATGSCRSNTRSGTRIDPACTIRMVMLYLPCAIAPTTQDSIAV